MSINLIVDLDHTLITTDILQLSIKIIIKKQPIKALLIPFWLMRGKGFLKDKLTKIVNIDITKLPYNQHVLNYIKNSKQKGHKVILATASHYKYANQISEYLQLFDQTLSSNKNFNLSSINKADVLIKKFGKKNFDYIGDHIRDMPVWRAANLTIVVKEASQSVMKKTKKFNRVLL